MIDGFFVLNDLLNGLDINRAHTVMGTSSYPLTVQQAIINKNCRVTKTL